MNTLDAFDELVKLKDNPEALVKRQQEIINEAIEQCPKRLHERLKQNQWCLEQELKKYKDPVARMNKMVEIFWKGVNNFQNTLKNPVIKESTNESTIIPFKKK